MCCLKLGDDDELGEIERDVGETWFVDEHARDRLDEDCFGVSLNLFCEPLALLGVMFAVIDNDDSSSIFSSDLPKS